MLRCNTSTTAEGELESYNEEAKHEHSNVDVTNATPAIEPNLAAPAKSLHSAPEAMSHVEPDSNEPHYIEDSEDRIAKSESDDAVTISGVDAIAHISKAIAHQLGKHHVIPEVEQVEQKTEHNDNAEHEHVLRCPLYLFGFANHCIAVVATSLTVLESQNEGVDEVDGYESSEAEGSSYSISVGTQHFAYHVIAIF